MRCQRCHYIRLVASCGWIDGNSRNTIIELTSRAFRHLLVPSHQNYNTLPPPLPVSPRSVYCFPRTCAAGLFVTIDDDVTGFVVGGCLFHRYAAKNHDATLDTTVSESQCAPTKTRDAPTRRPHTTTKARTITVSMTGFDSRSTHRGSSVQWSATGNGTHP
jgi:hypothetical protein